MLAAEIALGLIDEDHVFLDALGTGAIIFLAKGVAIPHTVVDVGLSERLGACEANLWTWDEFVFACC